MDTTYVTQLFIGSWTFCTLGLLWMLHVSWTHFQHPWVYTGGHRVPCSVTSGSVKRFSKQLHHLHSNQQGQRLQFLQILTNNYHLVYGGHITGYERLTPCYFHFFGYKLEWASFLQTYWSFVEHFIVHLLLIIKIGFVCYLLSCRNSQSFY